MTTPIKQWAYCFAILCCFFSACQSFVDEKPFFEPQPEKIVVAALLSAGDTVRNVFVSHTFAPLDSLVPSSLEGISVIITVDGIPVHLQRQQKTSWQLQPPSVQGVFFEAPTLIARAGKRYSLTVQWRDKSAHAETFVPEAARVDSIALYERFTDVRDVILDVTLTPRPFELYFVNQLHPPKKPLAYNLVFPGEFSTGMRYQDTNVHGKVLLRSMLSRGYSDRGIGNASEYNSFAEVFTFDAAFWQYYTTSRYDDIRYDGNPFISQRRSTKGNVTGDGLGVFAGVHRSVYPISR